MAIQASNISIVQNPNDQGGTLITFTRGDTGAVVSIPVSVNWSGTQGQIVGQIKSAMVAWEAQANAISTINAALVGVTV